MLCPGQPTSSALCIMAQQLPGRPAKAPCPAQKACVSADNREDVAGAATGAEAETSVLHAKTKERQPRPGKAKPPVLPASLGVSPASHHGREKAHLHSKYQKIRQHRDGGEEARPLGHAQATRLGVDFGAPSSPQTRVSRPLRGEQPLGWGLLQPALARTRPPWPAGWPSSEQRAGFTLPCCNPWR